MWGLRTSKQVVLENAKEAASHALQQVLEGVSFPEGVTRFPFHVLNDPRETEISKLWENTYSLSDNEAKRALEDILVKYENRQDALSSGGLPIQPLAHWRLLSMEKDVGKLLSRASALATCAVTQHPSILTPELLERAEALLKSHGIDTAFFSSHWAQWNEIEWAAHVWAANGALMFGKFSITWSGPTPPPPLKPFWITSEGYSGWWVSPYYEIQPDGKSSPFPLPRLISSRALKSFVDEVSRKAESLLPKYTALDVSAAGQTLIWPKAPEGSALAAISASNMEFTALLQSPELLYAQQRTQTLWLGALLACAFLAELAAFWFIQRALRRETELGEMKSNFVSSVSHELRAPIASMRLMAENLESGAVSDPQRAGEYHRLMAEECRRLSALIDNVLDFARIEQDRKSYHFAESDIAALIQDAVQLMQPTATQRKQKVVTEIEPIEPPVCDSLAIRQALINLLDNAIKFAPEETAITVRLRQVSAGCWELSVNDQGVGIPANEQERIFDRFYRVGDELRRETQGAGIGLSIVKHIVEAHGGSVKVESQPGSTTFILSLPQTPPEIPKV